MRFLRLLLLGVLGTVFVQLIGNETLSGKQDSDLDGAAELQKVVARLRVLEEEFDRKGLQFRRIYLPAKDRRVSDLSLQRIEMNDTDLRVLSHHINSEDDLQDESSNVSSLVEISELYLSEGNLLIIQQRRRVPKNSVNPDTISDLPISGDRSESSSKLEISVSEFDSELGSSFDQAKRGYSIPFFATGYFAPWPEKRFSQWLDECTVEKCVSSKHAGRDCVQLNLVHPRARIEIAACPELGHRIVEIKLTVDRSSIWRGKPMSEYGIQKAEYHDVFTEFNDDLSEFVLESSEVSDLLNENGDLVTEHRQNASRFSDYRIGSNSSWLMERTEVPNGHSVVVKGRAHVEHVWQDGKPVPTWDAEREKNLASLAGEAQPSSEQSSRRSLASVSAFPFWIWPAGGTLILILVIILWIRRS